VESASGGWIDDFSPAPVLLVGVFGVSGRETKNFRTGGIGVVSRAAPPFMSQSPPRILYCHCQYAQVVPKEVKEAVLRKLCESGVAFEAVADLCEMAARRDPALQRLAAEGAVKIAACFPRAVKGLFHQANADLSPERTEVLNMRTLTADDVIAALLSSEVQPNVPVGKETLRITPAAAEPPAAS
jgi:hypothetical protein